MDLPWPASDMYRNCSLQDCSRSNQNFDRSYGDRSRSRSSEGDHDDGNKGECETGYILAPIEGKRSSEGAGDNENDRGLKGYVNDRQIAESLADSIGRVELACRYDEPVSTNVRLNAGSRLELLALTQ